MERHEELAAPLSQGEVGDPAALELRLIGTICGGGNCPTLFRTNRGTLVVQGTAIEAGEAGLTLSPGETLVEIPEDLIEQYLQARAAGPAA